MVSFDSEISELQHQVERQIEGKLQQIDRITDHNQWKVINAFQQRKVSDFHFAGSTGYAYNDRGREVLDEVYADVFGAEAALVRPHFASGTHTISTALLECCAQGTNYCTSRVSLMTHCIKLLANPVMAQVHYAILVSVTVRRP